MDEMQWVRRERIKQEQSRSQLSKIWILSQKHLTRYHWARYSTSVSLKCLLLKEKIIISILQSGGSGDGGWKRGGREKEKEREEEKGGGGGVKAF